MKVTFHNPGVIDPQSWSTMGLNAKESQNAIGFFGTGLKYSIAQIVGNGGEIRIKSGGKQYLFGHRATTFRDKEVKLITVNGRDLGYTTELGKTWKPWMVFRELLCNARDEGGAWSTGTVKDDTVIEVKWDPFREVVVKFDTYFINERRKPIIELPGLQVYGGANSSVFYQGIAVFCDPDAPARFTYNITKKLDLSEDRTASSWCVRNAIANSVVEMSSYRHLDVIIGATNGLESQLNFEYCPPVSDTFVEVVRAKHRKGHQLQRGCLKAIHENTGENLAAKVIPFNSTQQLMLDRVLDIMTQLDLKPTVPIVLIDTAGDSLYGKATDKIELTAKAFQHGLKDLFQTLLEEHYHIETGHRDCTREFQEYLFRQLTSALLTTIGQIL